MKDKKLKVINSAIYLLSTSSDVYLIYHLMYCAVFVSNMWCYITLDDLLCEVSYIMLFIISLLSDSDVSLD